MEPSRYKVNRFLYTLRDIRRGITTIKTISELDEILGEVEVLFKTSHDKAMAKLNGIRLDLRMPLNLDPYSDEYRSIVEGHYRSISGRSAYAAEQNEKSQFNLDEAKRRPFPYQTNNPSAVGEQLVAQGFVINEMNLPAGARVLEMGAGWGNLTLQLAMTGYETHAVEIDAPTIEIIKHRAKNQHVEIVTHQCDMINFHTIEKFDAIIFYESFHHSFYPLKLLEKMRSLLKDTGQLVLAGEPITIYPNPWSLRGDGLSLWSIRKYGWLELGFDTNFLLGYLIE